VSDVAVGGRSGNKFIRVGGRVDIVEQFGVRSMVAQNGGDVDIHPAGCERWRRVLRTMKKDERVLHQYESG